MKVTAIIVNYFTSAFLPKLLHVLNHENQINEIVIADNSSESELENFEKDFHKVHLLTFNENIGFAAAVNRVVEKYPSDFYLLINPDTLPDRGFTEKLMNGAIKTNALLTGPRFYWDDSKSFKLPPALGYSWGIQIALHIANISAADAKLLSFQWTLCHQRFWEETQAFYEPFLSGACILVRFDPSFFINGKIFDERFFLYYEDTDLCYQALLKNEKVFVVPDAEVVHYWNQSPSNQKHRWMAESEEKFMEKNYGVTSNLKASKAIAIDSDIKEEDLGEINLSTKFELKDSRKNESYFFDLGLNQHFIPFAQTSIKGPHYIIPKTILDKLSPGYYYSRVRNNFFQTLKIWKWKKS